MLIQFFQRTHILTAGFGLVLSILALLFTSDVLAANPTGSQPGDDAFITFSSYQSPYYVQRPLTECTQIQQGFARAIAQVFKESYAQASVLQEDKRVWIYDLNKRSGCPGHGNGHTSNSMDIGYFTKHSSNDTAGAVAAPRTKSGEGVSVADIKAGTNEGKLNASVFDLQRNWSLWVRLKEVLPDMKMMVHPVIKAYLLEQMPASASLIHSFISDGCASDTFCYNHQTHAHISFYSGFYKEVNWSALGGGAPLAVSIVPVLNTTVSGSDNILFPVRNGTGMFNQYPAYCQGNYSLSTAGSRWLSQCDTGWQLLANCKAIDGTAIKNCPDRAPSASTEGTCLGNVCYGYNTKLTSVSNNRAFCNAPKMNPGAVFCKGRWFVDTSSCNWVQNCETGWVAVPDPVDTIELVSSVNSYVSGKNDVIFPVQNTTGFHNPYPAYCAGNYWIDTRGTTWVSKCDTAWHYPYSCTMSDGKKIPNCPAASNVVCMRPDGTKRSNCP